MTRIFAWREALAGPTAFLACLIVLPAGTHAQVISSWESSIATVDTAVGSGKTIRQFARLSIGGAQFRVRISNETGTAPLHVADAHVALPGTTGGSIAPASDHVVTFNGGKTILVAPGGTIVSDPVDMPVPPLTRLAVSAFFRSASPVQVGHLLASELNYIAAGDHAGEATMPGATPSESGFYLAGLSIVTGGQFGGVVACLGDSLTDGLESTVGGEHRYPDRLAERLLAVSYGRLGAINAGLVGNSLLGGASLSVAGSEAGRRFVRDVLGRPGVHWLILFEGINDIIYPPASGDTAAELIAAYQQAIAAAHARGIKVFGATLTPYAGSGPEYYSAAKERVRQTVNAWIRTAGAYDAVLDFDAVVRQPQDPLRLRPAYDGGDHLHLSDAGYAAIADAIPLALFR